MKKFFHGALITTSCFIGGLALISSSCMSNGHKSANDSSATTSAGAKTAAIADTPESDEDTAITDKVADVPVAATTAATKTTPGTKTADEPKAVARQVAGKTVNLNKNGLAASTKRLAYQQQKTLKEAYKNYFPIGAAINPDTALVNPVRAQFIADEYASLTPKRALQPFWVHRTENEYHWKEADMIVDFAQAHNMKVRGHCLIYNIHMPKWFFIDANKQPVTKDVLLQRMKDHITTEVSRYKGRVYCWDVVNEAIYGKKTFFFPTDQFYQIIGEDYIGKAFQFAHAADPDAKLFYNDAIYTDEKLDAVYGFLKKLKAQGIPINGVGLECHLGADGMTKEFLQTCIDKFSSIGLDVQVTELDVSIYPKTSTKDLYKLAAVSDQYTDQVADQQATTYDNIFSVCRKNKGKVTGLTMWGDSDGPNSLETKLKKTNYPMLFDRSMKPKMKAFNKVVNFTN